MNTIGRIDEVTAASEATRFRPRSGGVAGPARTRAFLPVCLRLRMALLTLLLLIAHSTNAVRANHDDLPQPESDPADDAVLFTPPGFDRPGVRAIARGDHTGVINLSILDRATGKPTPARVNVIAADGNYYQPQENPLAAFGLGVPYSTVLNGVVPPGEEPLYGVGNRPGAGPLRYIGWYFYCSGQTQVRVPPGPVRVEVWKGIEFRPETATTHLEAAATQDVTISLERTAGMTERHYYSGDTHIHLNRRTESDDQRALDLLEAEDLSRGFLLCWNRFHHYSGTMGRMSAPQMRGLGPDSIVWRGNCALASGQEYTSSSYGHACFLMHWRLALSEQTAITTDWPLIGVLGREVRAMGGYAFNAHGGHSQEIFADIASRATDGVELLQFAAYRGIGVEGWYRVLNIGFRFPAIGASDFPFCRSLGDSRTYVHAPTAPEPGEWARLASEGRSFFTTGPLLLLEVEDQSPGGTIDKRGKGPHRVRVRLRCRSEVTPVAQIDLIVNGLAIDRFLVPRLEQQGKWLELEREIELSESSWIAARAHSSGNGSKPDAESHTNPVYVNVDRRAPYREKDLDWLLERIQDQIDAVSRRKFEERSRVIAFCESSRDELLRIRAVGGLPSIDPRQGPQR
ncbi:MAG: hypothetical protein FJ295_21075 [Planctomycetes bacterium]|nr:hypothetical protein [Planctomycetota bacterium]